MRLSEHQRSIIRISVAENFGAEVVVRLFGSRADDSQRGGDIDLLIETQQSDVNKLVSTELPMLADLQTQLGEQRIDVLLAYPTRQMHSAILGIPKAAGILL